MKISKRLLAFALCVLLLVGILPAQTFAAETGAVKVEHNGETTYYADLQKAFDGFAPSNNTYGGKYVITLLDNISGMTKVKNLQYPTEVLDITLDLNGYTITGNGTNIAVNINLGSNASGVASGAFTIKDSSGNNSGKITGGKGGVYVYGKNATLNFQGGTITGNHGASKGGGILVGATTYLNMTGGVITGNSVTGTSSANTGYGGGICVNYGTISGGVITGNTAYKGSHLQTGRGGGVCTEITRTKGYSTLEIADGVVYGNTAENAGDDVMAQGNGLSGTKWSLSIGTENWYIDGWNGKKATKGNGEADRYDANNPVAYTDGGFVDTYDKSLGLKYVAPAEDPIPEQPEAPTKYGENVTPALIRVICDSDPDHAPIDIKWQFQSTEIYPKGSAPVWDEEIGAWTIGVKIDSITVYYVWMNFEKVYNDIVHDPVIGMPLPEDTYHIVTNLKWDVEQQLWVTMDDKPIDIHVTCKTMPSAPTYISMRSYQVKVMGDLDGDGIYGENGLTNESGIYEVYTTSIPESGFTIGNVYGSREEGFFVDVTASLADGDIYITNWIEKRAPGVPYVYDWSKTDPTITFTLKYTGDLDGNLQGDTANDWVLVTTGQGFGVVAEAYVKAATPMTPTQDNVTDHLVSIFCDSDHNHTSVFGKWYPQNCTTMSDITWSDELNTWVVDVRVDSMEWYYVHLQLEKTYSNIHHELASSNYVDTTLYWDDAQGLWLPTETIEVHATCKTTPTAPTYNQLSGYQVKVWGDVNGQLKKWTTSIPEEGYTIGEVYGSREEGFFVDVTITLTEGDIYQATWIANRNPGYFYNYDWDQTTKTVTFTLRYNGSLTGTLYGDRHASNTNYDWVLASDGKTYGVVSEAYLKQITCTVNLVIYRNGNTTTPYKTVSLGKIAKGDTLDLTALDIAEYYTSSYGFAFDGWYNDGLWNSYKKNGSANGLDSIYINGWTNIICMVTDYQIISIKGVVNGDKDTAETIFTGKAPYGENLIAWLDANVNLPEKPGYTANTWWNWDWYGHKFDDSKLVTGWTNVYVDYQANEYTLTLDPTGGKVEPSTITVTFNEAIGELPEATRSGYIFDGWVDADGNEVTAETIYTVVGDSTISAKWIRHPGSGSGNVTKELFTIQCTTDHDHSWLCNWFGNHVKLVSGSVVWNEELGRWEAQASIGSSMLSQINSTQPKKNYFGGIKHYYDTTNYVFDLYYDPDFTGLNSEGKEVTGMWLPVEQYIVDVYCYDKPAAPDISKIASKLLWIRDADPAFKSTSSSIKYTVKQLIDGTYTLGEMYEKDGKFYVDITITDLAPYITALSEKNGKNYILPEWTNHKSAGDFTFTLVYTGSTTDYKQDGTGWSLDTSALTSKEKGNGVSLWLTEQFTITYADGIGGKLFEDVVLNVYAFGENGGTKDDWADFTATATPTITDPARYGFVFKGWNPEVAETVTADVTYTAVWEIIPVNVYYYINGELVHTVVLDTEETVTAYNVYDFQYEKDGYTLTCWYEKASDIGNAYKAEPNMPQSFLNKKILRLYGTSTPNTYTVTLDANGGTVDPTYMTVTFDAAVGTLPVPTKTGYTFVGWMDANGTKVIAETVYTVVGDSSWTAEWSANTYTITLDAQGGEVDPADVNVVFDQAVNTLPVPTKTGYTFGGWFDADGKEYTAETVYAVAGDVTLTAKWTANEYTITLDDGSEETTDKTVTFDAPVGELPVPTKTGYTFGGWFDADGKEYTAETVYAVAGDVTLTAKWTANEYTITFDDGSEETTDKTVTFDAPVGELPAPSKEGHTFGGWFDADGNEYTAETVYAVAGNVTLTAKWTANTYTVTLDDGNGNVTTIEVTYGETITELPEPTREGYYFDGWVDADGNKVSAETVYSAAADSTYTAVWSAIPNTGDDMLLIPAILMLLLSAAVVLYTAEQRKKAEC